MENDVNTIAAGEVVASAADGTTTTTTEAVPVTPDRPLLTTKFEDYTVTEGLLLLILLSLVIGFLFRIVKEGL